MAKREPKLGDVKSRSNPKNRRMYRLYARVGGKWVLMAHGYYSGNVEAAHKEKLRRFLQDVIREAREGGAKDKEIEKLKAELREVKVNLGKALEAYHA